MFMCESNKFLPYALLAAVYLCYFYFPLLLAVVGGTRACKSSAVSYRCIMMLNKTETEIRQDPHFFLKIDHEVRVMRQVVAFWDEVHRRKHPGFPIGQGMKSVEW